MKATRGFLRKKEADQFGGKSPDWNALKLFGKKGGWELFARTQLANKWNKQPEKCK